MVKWLCYGYLQLNNDLEGRITTPPDLHTGRTSITCQFLWMQFNNIDWYNYVTIDIKM